MIAEEELMALLQEKPYLFGLSRDKPMMQVIKELEKGGKSATELSEMFKLDYKKLKEKLEDLVENNALDKTEQGDHWIYFLSFDTKEFLDLYKKSKKQI